MGFFATILDTQNIADDLHQALPLTAQPGIEIGGRHIVTNTLSEYIVQHLFLPILRDGEIPTEGLDFARISDEDLLALSAALEALSNNKLLGMANTFCGMAPDSARKARFI